MLVTGLNHNGEITLLRARRLITGFVTVIVAKSIIAAIAGSESAVVIECSAALPIAGSAGFIGCAEAARAVIVACEG